MEHFNKLLSRSRRVCLSSWNCSWRSYECITGKMYAQTHIHVPRNKLIVAHICILMNLINTYLISWNKPAMRDAKAHPRKIASVLTAHIHIHNRRNVNRGCECRTSRNSLYLPHVCRCMYPDFVTCEDQPAHHTVLTAPSFLEQNIKHFVGPDLGPNCLVNKFVTASLGGGGGGGGWVRHC